MPEAIQRVTEQNGRLYEPGQEAHYQALAAATALRGAGYSIEKTEPDAQDRSALSFRSLSSFLLGLVLRLPLPAGRSHLVKLLLTH
jgi:hypothetical protein